MPGKEGNPDNYDYPDHESALFVFDENGVFQKEKSGMYDDNGVTRWIENGMVVWHAGLVKDGDDFRYFKRNGMVTNIETYVAKTNGLLKAAKYTFLIPGPGMFVNVRNAPRVVIAPHLKQPLFRPVIRCVRSFEQRRVCTRFRERKRMWAICERS